MSTPRTSRKPPGFKHSIAFVFNEQSESINAVVFEIEDEIVSEEDAPKPKKRRSKKVSTPEEFENNNECSESNNNDETFEDKENETICENIEG